MLSVSIAVEGFLTVAVEMLSVSIAVEGFLTVAVKTHAKTSFNRTRYRRA